MQKLTQPRYLRTAPPLSIKLAGEPTSEGVIEGYGSTFGGEPDAYGDIIAPGAFAASLSEHKAQGTTPLMLWAHHMDEPIGKWTEFHEDGRGLFLRGKINLATTRGADAYAHLRADDLSGLSIGYTVNEGGLEYGKSHGTYLLTSLSLQEVSVVAIGANRNARVTGVKSFGSKPELEAILKDAGLPARAAKKLMLGGWPALARDDESAPEVTTLLKRLQAATLELKGINR